MLWYTILSLGPTPPIPDLVWIKNRTDGNIDVAINAMISASDKHSFLGIDINGQASIVHTNGNKNSGQSEYFSYKEMVQMY